MSVTIIKYCFNKIKARSVGIIKLRIPILLILTFALIIPGVSCDDSGSSETIDNGTPTAGWVADGAISTGEYAWTRIYGKWEINWRADDQYIYIGLKAATTGWVALGIQPGSRMKNADIMLGFVQDGQTTVYDLFSTGDFGPHPADTELGGTADILEFAGSEQDGETTIEFKRLLITGDSYDNPLSEGVNKIIWSYGSSDNYSAKHTIKGYGELQL